MDAVILAAGLGTRMGGRKARLIVDGVPLALAHVRRARSLGARRVLVVARPDDLAFIGREADVVSSTASDAAGSLALGVRALALLGGDGPDVLVVPVDSLPVGRDVLDGLAAALGPGIDAVRPTHEGRGGHPVLVRWSVLWPYLGAAAPPPLRDVLRALGARRVDVPVADPSVVVDLDTVADVARVTGGPARFQEDDGRG